MIKFFLLANLLLISSQVFATPWSEIELNTSYITDTDLPLKDLMVPAGSQLLVDDIIGLDYIRVVIFEAQWKECPSTELLQEMEILPYRDTEFGLELENCRFKFYLETKDLPRQSFLRIEK